MYWIQLFVLFFGLIERASANVTFIGRIPAEVLIVQDSGAEIFDMGLVRVSETKEGKVRFEFTEPLILKSDNLVSFLPSLDLKVPGSLLDALKTCTVLRPEHVISFDEKSLLDFAKGSRSDYLNGAKRLPMVYQFMGLMLVINLKRDQERAPEIKGSFRQVLSTRADLSKTVFQSDLHFDLLRTLFDRTIVRLLEVTETLQTRAESRLAGPSSGGKILTFPTCSQTLKED